MTIHSTQCTWNAIASAAENVRDAIADNPFEAIPTMNQTLTIAYGYQSDHMVTCDIDCADRAAIVTVGRGRNPITFTFRFSSLHWNDSGALHELLCENDPGDSYTVRFRNV